MAMQLPISAPGFLGRQKRFWVENFTLEFLEASSRWDMVRSILRSQAPIQKVTTQNQKYYEALSAVEPKCKKSRPKIVTNRIGLNLSSLIPLYLRIKPIFQTQVWKLHIAMRHFLQKNMMFPKIAQCSA